MNIKNFILQTYFSTIVDEHGDHILGDVPDGDESSDTGNNLPGGGGAPPGDVVSDGGAPPGDVVSGGVGSSGFTINGGSSLYSVSGSNRPFCHSVSGSNRPSGFPVNGDNGSSFYSLSDGNEPSGYASVGSTLLGHYLFGYGESFNHLLLVIDNSRHINDVNIHRNCEMDTKLVLFMN